MSYTIDNTPLAHWDFRAGWIKSKGKSYALSGIWSLPKRLGKTHHDWAGDIEPYVGAGDINLGGRDLELSIVCKAHSVAEFASKVRLFNADLKDSFTLEHALLGAFEVNLINSTVTHYSNGWGQAVLKLREPRPTIGSLLPVPDDSEFGIDGYGWGQLGLVVSGIKSRYDLPAFTPIKITTSPTYESISRGSRKPKTITIEGTIKGVDYSEFRGKVEVLQALMCSPGMRRIQYFDSSIIDAFCVDGFSIDKIMRFGGDVHWGKFNCQMLVQ